MLAIARCFDPAVFYSVDDLHSSAAGVAAPQPRRRPFGLVPRIFTAVTERRAASF